MIQSLLVLEVVGLCFICSGVSATFMLTASKFGWLDMYQSYRRQWMPELCIFCLGFWLCFTQAAILFSLFNHNLFYIAIPLAGAPITKVLYAGSLNRPG